MITALGGVAVGWPLTAHAQQAAAAHRIGLLMNYEEGSSEAQGWIAAFREGLSMLGLNEGQNIKFDYRWVDNDATLMRRGARELVAMQPDLIFSTGSPTTAVLLRETHTIPIVFANLIDPVGQGFVTSLSHPGGNATGLVNLEPSMAGKWLELLKQVAPALVRVVVPYNPTSAPYAELYLTYFKSTAASLGLELIAVSFADMAALEAVTVAQSREPNTGFVPMPSGFGSGHVNEIAMLMVRQRLPAIYVTRSFAAAGGLMSYGNDITDNYRRAAAYVDRILKGEKPGELPVQFPTKFNLVINLKTAKALGLTVPLPLQASADEVIE